MITFITIFTAIITSSAIATLIQFFVNRRDNRNEWRKKIEFKIDKLDADLKDDRELRKRDKAEDSRRNILAASDAIIHGERHSKEWWIQLHKDISDYESYCSIHTDYKNNHAVQAIKNLNLVYAEKLNNNDFI